MPVRIALDAVLRSPYVMVSVLLHCRCVCLVGFGSNAPGACLTSLGILIFLGCSVVGLFFSSLSPSLAVLFSFS